MMNVNSRCPETRLSFIEIVKLEQCFRDGKTVAQATAEVGCSYKSASKRYVEFREGVEVLTEKQFQAICRIAERRGYVAKTPPKPDRHYRSDFELPAGTTGL